MTRRPKRPVSLAYFPATIAQAAKKPMPGHILVDTRVGHRSVAGSSAIHDPSIHNLVVTKLNNTTSGTVASQPDTLRAESAPLPDISIESIGDSRPDAFEFDPWLQSDSTEFAALVEAVDGQLRSVSPKKRYRNERMDNLRLLLANLIVARHQEPDKPIKYFRTSKAYSAASVYRPKFMSAKMLRSVADGLEQLGYVSGKLGHKDAQDNNSMMSLVWATDRFGAVCRDFRLNREAITRNPKHPVVILKSKKRGKYKRRTRIEHGKSTIIISMTGGLRRYNEFLKGFEVSLPPELHQNALREARERSKHPAFWMARNDKEHDLPDFISTELYRVFNDVDPIQLNLDRGGRFYGGWWQSVPKEYRPFITIDGQPTVESDYAAFHPRMLYHLSGRDCDEPYEIEEVTRAAGHFDPTKLRNANKKLLNILINATQRQIRFAIKKNPPNKLLERWGIELPDHLAVPDVLVMLAEHHAAISSYFGTGAGLGLQAKDAEICDRILRDGERTKTPILPIHDSFIVMATAQDWIEWKMIEKYRKVINGFTPRLKTIRGTGPSPGMLKHKLPNWIEGAEDS